MEQRMTMIGLGVKDLDISKSFYETVFGWMQMQPEKEGIVFYRLNGIILSLYPTDKLAQDATVSPVGSGFKGVTCAYNTHTEAEVDALFTQFISKGINIVKMPEKAFWGGYSGYISDPDDHLWEIAFNPFWKLDSDGNIK